MVLAGGRAGWRADLSSGARWTLLLDAAHGSPASAIVAAAVVERSIAAGVADEILSGLSQRQAIRWLQLEGWSSIVPTAAGPLWRRPDGNRGETLRRWRATLDAADARLVWLATLMSVTERPACAADPRLPGRIAFALRSLDEIEARQRGERLQAIDAEGEPRGDAGIEPRHRGRSAGPNTSSVDRRGTAIDGEEAIPTAPLPGSVGAPLATAGQPILEKESRVEARDVAAQPVDDYTQPLVAASIAFWRTLFLVRVLEQLGFSAFLAEHPALLDRRFRRVCSTPSDSAPGCRSTIRSRSPFALKPERIRRRPKAALSTRRRSSFQRRCGHSFRRQPRVLRSIGRSKHGVRLYAAGAGATRGLA